MSHANTLRRAVVAIALTLALSGSAHGATFGANVGGLFPPGQQPTSYTMGALLALRQTGATVARTDSYWSTAEPTAPVNGIHTYNWTYDDTVATALAKVGLRWQPIVDYATLWAANSGGGSNPGVVPAHVGDYPAYARAFAARYGQGGTFWAQHPDLWPQPVSVFEIWNEPDLPEFWGPQPDLAEYASMFLWTRVAIKSVDPAAKVIIGGLVFPRQSLPALLAARPDLHGNVDGIGVHPYRPTLALTMQSVTYDLQTDAATFGVPLYVNEFGWWAPGPFWPDDTEAIRDSNTAQATEMLGRDPYIADVESYCWGCVYPYDLYGTPAASAFAAGIAWAQAQGPAALPAAAAEPTATITVQGQPVLPQVSTTPGHGHRHHKKRHRHDRRKHRHHGTGGARVH